jgi:hypothetical protein
VFFVVQTVSHFHSSQYMSFPRGPKGVGVASGVEHQAQVFKKLTCLAPQMAYSVWPKHGTIKMQHTIWRHSQNPPRYDTAGFPSIHSITSGEATVMISPRVHGEPAVPGAVVAFVYELD